MSSIWLAGHGLTQSETTIDYPRPDRLVTGNPKRSTQSLYDHPNMNCGIWECEVGAWNIVFAENKQIHILKFLRVKQVLSHLHLWVHLK